MPKIYEYFGLVFLFYANEHLPIHVHVKYNEFESKFEFVYENGKLIELKRMKVKKANPLPPAQLKDAEIFIRKYHSQISNKWTEFFVLRKKIKTEKINKRIR